MHPIVRFALKRGMIQMQPHHVDLFREDENVDMLIRAVSARRFRVRLAAVEALGRIGGQEVIPPLRRMLRDPVRLVALSAIETLGRVDSESTEEIASAEAYWVARAQRRNQPPPAVEEKLIDGEKLERFQEFKRKVLAQAGKGRFYG